MAVSSTSLRRPSNLGSDATEFAFAPRYSEHTKPVLEEAGLGANEIATLETDGIIPAYRALREHSLFRGSAASAMSVRLVRTRTRQRASCSCTARCASRRAPCVHGEPEASAPAKEMRPRRSRPSGAST